MMISPRFFSVLTLVLVVCLGLSAGCSFPPKTDSTPPALITETPAAGVPGTTPATAGGICAEGQTTCAGTCRNTLADSSNCGRCGNACSAAQYCNNGACTAGTLHVPVTGMTPSAAGTITCSAGQTPCSGVCRNLLADTSNCGRCGNVCSSGQMCGSGTCAGTYPAAVTTTVPPTTLAAGASCPGGLTNCGGTCVNLQSSDSYCGSCWNSCPSGRYCSGGVCTGGCPSGSTACGAVCSNMQVDAENCGSCGNRCSVSEYCNGGVCTSVCPSGSSYCSGFCSDYLTDPTNCGSCGYACSAGQSCNSGICTGGIACGSGFTPCGAGCSNTQIDELNCGSCGNTCQTGYTCCGGICQDLSENNVNCGFCGNACPSTQHCSGSVCVDGYPWVVITATETPASACGKGLTLCSGGKGSICTDLASDNSNCGACGYTCTGGTVCAGGSCGFIIR